MSKIDWNNITEAMKNMGKKSYTNEDQVANLYQPKMKDDGTYDAVIRFLPSPDTDLPFVLLYNHSYQSESTGKWMIDNCPVTIGRKCPVCENASKLWNGGHKDDNTKKRFKKFSAYSNILVVKDPTNPENEGKVFVFRYGKKMFELIKSKIVPTSDIDEQLKVFDWKEGANFKLRIRAKKTKTPSGEKTFPNYDSSEFSTPSPVGSDEYISSVESQLHSLKSIIEDNGTRYKSFEQLANRLAFVEGYATKDETPVASTSTSKAVEDTDGEEDEEGFFKRLRGE